MVRGIKGPLLESATELLQRAMGSPWSVDQVEAALVGRGTRHRLRCEQEGVAGRLDPGALIGLLLARRVAHDELEIDLVVVDPAQRRRGIARALLRDLLEAESAEGIVDFRLEMAATNDPARALYASLGFVVVGRRARYYPDGDDALLWSRRSPGAPAMGDRICGRED